MKLTNEQIEAKPTMKVVGMGDGPFPWAVMGDDGIVWHICATNSEAWAWLDRHDAEAQAHEEKREQISKAVSQW